jgi:hypothetical protein
VFQCDINVLSVLYFGWVFVLKAKNKREKKKALTIKANTCLYTEESPYDFLNSTTDKDELISNT